MGEFDPLRYLVNDLNSSAYRGVSRAYLTELARDPEVRQALYPALKEPGVTKDEKTGLAEVLAASGGSGCRGALGGALAGYGYRRLASGLAGGEKLARPAAVASTKYRCTVHLARNMRENGNVRKLAFSLLALLTGLSAVAPAQDSKPAATSRFHLTRPKSSRCQCRWANSACRWRVWSIEFVRPWCRSFPPVT